MAAAIAKHGDEFDRCGQIYFLRQFPHSSGTNAVIIETWNRTNSTVATQCFNRVKVTYGYKPPKCKHNALGSRNQSIRYTIRGEEGGLGL